MQHKIQHPNLPQVSQLGQSYCCTHWTCGNLQTSPPRAQSTLWRKERRIKCSYFLHDLRFALKPPIMGVRLSVKKFLLTYQSIIAMGMKSFSSTN
ncbi:hypothetical protein Y1Q_0021840 [Alligator mississippiensis]|uniref:Uncharacterized protein n=1 Tax=Alligator mississippiensis TaxID=8496 RepID=A0A151PC34_ALLMI|nr:hypothetical protein Y1Q_0021840 [Alligator mississippiensis]